ncbi:MAG: hypothetical protein ACI8ZX_000863 [Planctomycetota bacterium]|jgi:uncharacterized protein YqeY
MKIYSLLLKTRRMSLESNIMSAMKVAMKEKNQDDLRALRAIKSAIMLAKTEKGFAGEMTEEIEIALLQKLMKQRNDSLKIFVEQDRTDLASKEEAEMKVIQTFLPAQLSETEVETILKDIIKKTGASSMKDMGKVMGMAAKAFSGKADNSLVSKIVKSLLS